MVFAVFIVGRFLAAQFGAFNGGVPGVETGDEDGVFRAAPVANVALRAEEAFDAVNVEALARGRQGVGFGAFGGFYGGCFHSCFAWCLCFAPLVKVVPMGAGALGAYGNTAPQRGRKL